MANIDIQSCGTTVLSYCKGYYGETVLLEQLRADSQLKEVFASVRDEAIEAIEALRVDSLVLANSQLYLDAEVQPEVKVEEVQPTVEREQTKVESWKKLNTLNWWMCSKHWLSMNNRNWV